jgi:diamine N-acetyltransferase
MISPAQATAPSPLIREMQPSDIPAVSQLAERIWRAHYPGIISSEQIEYMLALMYSPASLKEQVQKGHRFWLIEDNAALAGYIAVEPKEPGHFFIQKLYVEQVAPRRGLGSALLNHAISVFKPRTLSLAVNRKNYKAINFYFKHGFTIEQPVVNDIGGGFVMDDFKMKRLL